jgi:ribonuclease BN (tRNA processing enzyme)
LRIRVLGAYGGSTPRHRQTSFLINGAIALDAGALTEALTLEEQSKVRAIVVTHSHMDHVASLPFLVENVFGRAEGPIEVIGTAGVVSSLQQHLFNDALWPDFTRIPNHLLPTVRFRVVEPLVPVAVDGLTITAIPVDHTVPTAGYLLQEGTGSVIFSSDTGPTEEIWRIARETPSLRAIFVECSFPDSMAEIADVSRHLTPSRLRDEMLKFPPGVPVNIYHMKPPTLPALRAEISVLASPRLRLLADDDELVY